MPQNCVTLLIKEKDRPARRVDVYHSVFTLGNAVHADVKVESVHKVRVRFAEYIDGYRAQNLAGIKPGEAVRTVDLKAATKIRTGDVRIQFFPSCLSVDGEEKYRHLLDHPRKKAPKREFDPNLEDTQRIQIPERTVALDQEIAASISDADVKCPAIDAHDEVLVVAESIDQGPHDAVPNAQFAASRLRRRVEINRFRARRNDIESTLRLNLDTRSATPAPLRPSRTDELLSRARKLLGQLDALNQKIDELPEAVEARARAS
ncbi:MAG: hypothetical protein AAF517_00040 [Planctomycetota bacterium]